MVITRPTPNWIILSVLTCMALIGFWRGFQDSMNSTRCIGATPGQNNPFPQIVVQPAKPQALPPDVLDVPEEATPVESTAPKPAEVKAVPQAAPEKIEVQPESAQKSETAPVAPVEPPAEPGTQPAQELPY